MKLGYSSKSLNNLLEQQSVEFQTQIKDWWGRKLRFAYILGAVCFADGLFFGFILPQLFK